MVNSLNNHISVAEPSHQPGKPTTVKTTGVLFGHKVDIVFTNAKNQSKLSQKDILDTISQSTVGKTELKNGVNETKLTFKNAEVIVLYRNSTLKTQLSGLKGKPLLPTQVKSQNIFQKIISKFSSPPKPPELNSKELKLLATLSQQDPTPAQKKELANLFSKSLGNISVNQQMDKLMKHPDKAGGIDANFVKLLRDFSYRTRGHENASSIADKTEKLMNALHEEKDVPDSEKLSLEEIGSIQSLVKLQDAMSLISKEGLDKLDPKLAALVSSFGKCEMVLEQVEDVLQKYSNLKGGDLLFVNNNKENRFRSREATFAEVRETFLLDAPLHHAAVNFKMGGKDAISQLMGDYKHEQNDLQAKLTSSTYRLNPELLLTKDPNTRTILSRMYAQGYGDEIRKMYQETQNELHSQGTHLFENVINDEPRRNKAGLAHIFTFLHKSTKEGGASRYKELYHAMMRGDLKAKEMICSEHTAKTLIAGLLMQEDKLKALMIDHMVNVEGKKRKEAEDLILPQALFTIPIDENESLSRMTPTRLLEVLAGASCIQRIDPHPVLQGIIKSNDLKPDAGENVIPVFDVSGYTAEEANLAELKTPVPADQPRVPKDNDINSKWNPALTKEREFGTRLDVALLKTEGATKEEKLYRLINDRRHEIKADKEYWRERHTSPERVVRLNKEGKLVPFEGGMGGAYKLRKDDDTPIYYIIKPSDEDLNSLNNRKLVASPLGSKDKTERNRLHIPKYRSVQTEVLSYEVAKLLGLDDITPKTEMVILKNKVFHDVLDGVKQTAGKLKDAVYSLAGKPDKEKLCSVQDFIPDAIDFNKLEEKRNTYNWRPDQFDKYMEENILQSDYEKCLLFACITGETDGNTGNYLFVKTKDNEGNDKLGIRKIDNGLCFPDKNSTEFSTCLEVMPHLSKPLSAEGRALIANINEEQIMQMINKYFPNSNGQAAMAFRERVVLLKEMAQEQGITLEQIHTAISNMNIQLTSSGKNVRFREPSQTPQGKESPPRLQASRADLNSSVVLTPITPREGVESPRKREALSPRGAPENANKAAENPLYSSVVRMDTTSAPTSPRSDHTPPPQKRDALSPRGEKTAEQNMELIEKEKIRSNLNNKIN